MLEDNDTASVSTNILECQNKCTFIAGHDGDVGDERRRV